MYYTLLLQTFFKKKDIYIMQYTDLQSFFVERFIELLHKNTLDSYRVRTHNNDIQFDI